MEYREKVNVTLEVLHGFTRTQVTGMRHTTVETLEQWENNKYSLE